MDFPTPGMVVGRVMRNYRGFEDHISSLTGLLDDRGCGVRAITREQKMVYVGTVDSVLGRLRDPGGLLIRMMHPPDGVEMPLAFVCAETGIRERSISHFYRMACLNAATGFMRRGLYVNFREELE